MKSAPASPATSVLFFSACPVDEAQLDVDEEYRAIEEERVRSRQRDLFDLRTAPAARVEDIRRRLAQHRPAVVHFGGHGQRGRGGLLLRGDDGNAVPLSIDALAELLRLEGGRVQCVVLNVCHTLALADAIARHVACVVGTTQAIDDRAALTFARGFYGALFDEKSLADAFDSGRNELRIAGVGDPEAFVLRCRPTVSPRETYVTQQASAPFRVPFLRNHDFVGRGDDLADLHARLGRSAAGDRPVALAGMGGIGKTQLAVEYAYRYRDAYPGGVYWVNAAASWEAELAARAEEVGIEDDTQPESRRQHRLARALLKRFADHPGALVIFDNVEDPLALQDARAELVPAQFAARLLFTTRRRDHAAPFDLVEMRVLPESAALELLLSRRGGATGHAPSALETAREICGSLGYLPLALALAAAFLGQNPRISFSSYLHRLHREGAIPLTDGAGIDARTLPTFHVAAIEATLRTQWDALAHDEARLVLQAAAILGESARVPRPSIALLSGLPDRAPAEGYPVPLEAALRELEELSLIEELTEATFQLHPLVREFAEERIASLEDFEAACAARLGEALRDMGRLHDEVAARGVYAVLADLKVGVAMAASGVREPLERLYRPLAREAHAIGRWEPSSQPGYFLQQLRNRCADLGLSELTQKIDGELAFRGWPHLRERLRTGCESDSLVRTLEGHKHWVTSLAVTRDGQWVISASLDDTLKVWELATGQEVRSLVGHTSGINAVAVTPDGLLAISASADRTLKVWDLATGRELRSLVGHTDSVVGVAVTPDGSVVSASADDTLKVWDLATGQELRSLVGHTSGVNAVAVTPDGQTAISASSDGTLKSWDLSTGHVRRTLVRHGPPRVAPATGQPTVSGVAVTPDGKFAFSASRPFHESIIELWDLQTGDQRPTRMSESVSSNGAMAIDQRKVRASWGNVRGVAVTADRRVLCASSDGTLKLWEPDGHRAIQILRGHADEVSGVAVTADGLLAVSASRDRTLKVWDLSMGPDSRNGEGHLGAVNRVAASSDGTLAVSASADGTLKVWDLGTGRLLRTLEGHYAGVNGVALTPDGALAVSASDDETLNVWDLATGAVVRTFASHNEEVKDVAVTPDGLLAISASRDDTLQVWEIATGRKLRTLRGHHYVVQGVAVTSDGRFAVSASSDPAIKVWDLATGAEIRTIESRTGAVHGVAVTPDGRLIVSTGWGRTLTVWDFATGQQVRVLEGHEARVTGVAVTPDSRFAVSTGRDRTVKVWDLATGRSRLTLAAHAPIECCAVTPDGRTVLAGDSLGGMHLLGWIDPTLR